MIGNTEMGLRFDRSDFCPLVHIGNTFAHFIKSVELLLSISAAIVGERIPAASYKILGPIPPSHVALEGSSAKIYNKIWSFVIKGTLL